MSTKILFVINGLGLGNSTRTHAIVERLVALGIEVHLASSGNGLWYFREVPEIRSLHEMSSFRYGSSGGRINILRTFRLLPEMWRSWRANQARLAMVLDQLRPDAVVTDSEYSYRPVKKRGIPLVALNNADVVLTSVRTYRPRPISILPQFLAVECLDYLFHALVPDLVISPSLDPTLSVPGRKFRRVGPIVRARFRCAATAPEGARHRVAVMLSGSTFGSELRFQRPTYPFTIDVIGREAPAGEAMPDGVVFHGKLRDSHALLANAEVLVVNGGFSAVSEAFCLRKPVVVIPVPGHAEQWVNAQAMERLGVGLMASEENFEEKMLEAYSRRRELLAAYEHFPSQDGAAAGAQAVLDIARARSLEWAHDQQPVALS